MLFASTIRLKMLAGLVMVLVMLIMLSFSGLSGQSSYRNVVNDLDLSINQAPRRADLEDALIQLLIPLSLQPRVTSEGSSSESREFARLQQAEFQKQLQKTSDQVSDYYSKFDRLPPTQLVTDNEHVVVTFLGRVQKGLDELKSLQESLGDPAQREATVKAFQNKVIQLTLKARNIPDYQYGLNQKLLKAKIDYRSHRQRIIWTSTVTVVLFLALGWYGYSGVFSPLKELHQGARRVALGNFDYRLELKTRDEMAELAEAFNLMTTRFQEVKNDLDRQVRERSKQLVRSERLAGIGFLAAGIAHEINNPLSAITMAADSMQDRLTHNPPGSESEDAAIIPQYLAMIQRESSHCQQITAKLLDFARGQQEERFQNDLALIVSEVLTMIEHMSKFHDRKIVFSPTQPCYLDINRAEIKQVILNIVANALESMKQGGTLRIDLNEETDQVILTFRDDGCGMTNEVIENLFDPFFTHGKKRQGTGLGMAISQRIIGDHGGTIEASSTGPGEGSTFYVHLPRKAASSVPAAA
jgi:two-component system NtrC family sensor kinase